MRRLTEILFVFLLAISLILGACAKPAPTPAPTLSPTPAPVPAPAQPSQVYKFKMQAFAERGTAYYDTHVNSFAAIVENASGGKIIIEVYGRNELYPTGEDFDAVQKGLVDLALDQTTFHVGTVPADGVAQGLPGAFPNIAVVFQFFRNYGFQEWHQKKNLDPIGIKMITPIVIDWAQLWSRKPINQIADLKGMKVRVPGMAGQLLARLGANVVTMAGGEVYAAGTQGLLDGATRGGAAEMEGLALYEPFPYVLTKPWTVDYTVSRVIMELGRWNKLPDDIKLILQSGFPGASLIFNSDMAWGITQALDRMLSKGQLKATELSPAEKVIFQEQKMALWDAYAKENPINAEAVQMLKDFTKIRGGL